MAILTSLNLLSEQRLGIDDMRRIESGVRDDFDTTVTAIITNVNQGYIVRGFALATTGAIGAPANGLQMIVDGSSVMHIAASVSGTIFQVPAGTPNQILNAATNTNVSGSFTANGTSYVGIDYNRFSDASTDIQKFIWNESANDEITTIAPAAQTLTYKIFITTSVWAANVLPVAIVTTDGNGNVLTITDARWMFCSLETGGINPNPSYSYPWTEGRTQSPITISSLNSSANPFAGGDKQLTCLKDWMNAIMSSLLEIKGTPYWFSGPGGSPPSPPLPTLISLYQDLSNTVITGAGEISNGILPNSDSLLVTTGTVSSGSNQLTSLGSFAGLASGDYIFGTGIPQNTTIVGTPGSTITMSNEATINGVGIGVTFYSPSVITAPGQINWNDPIVIDVIGSSLSYVIAANPSSSDITLANDQAAYITLVRDTPITPQLIFNSGSPTVTSVGAVTWTSGLLAGDMIKVGTSIFSGYYEILTINSGSSVTLTSNVLPADNYPTGTPAEYAFGSYLATATPTTNRNIFITSRETVPVNGDVFWLFLREDNGGSPKVYIRFLGMELDNGESVNISGTTSQELLQYIGSPSASASKPNYSASLSPGSLAEMTDITIGGGSTITGGQYLQIYSSADARQYAVWFKVSGSGTAPVVPNVNAYIEVDILSGDSATTVASKLASALNTTPFGDFTASSGAGTLVITNTSAGFASATFNGNVGAPFVATQAQAGTGVGNFIIHDGDNLTLAIKELDQAYGELIASLDSPTYDEVVEIVASGATPPTSLNGPVANSTVITIPLNSRESNTLAQYTVGKGTLQVFLNGQFLDVESGAYSEVGAAGTPSNQIEILTLPGGGLVVGYELEFRIGLGGGGGGGSSNIPGPAGSPGPPGMNSAGGPVAISTKTTNYTVLTGDCFLAANCTSNPIIFTLPVASSNTGRIFYFKKIDASSNAMSIVGNGSDTIDGSSLTTNVQYEEFSLISNGSTGWWVF
jgi:hypothetical protein